MEVSPQETEILEDYFKLQYFLFKWTGVPLRNLTEFNTLQKILYSFYSLFCVGFIALCFYSCELIHLCLNIDDMYIVSFIVSYIISHTMGICKVFLLFIKHKRISAFLDSLESGVFKPDVNRCGSMEFKVIKRAIWIANLQAQFICGLGIFVILSQTLASMYNPGLNVEVFDRINNVSFTKHIKTLPYMSWFPFDTNTSPLYEVAVIYQLFGAYIYAIYVGGADAVINGIMLHVKAQFLILHKRLDNYIEETHKILNLPMKGDEEGSLFMPESFLKEASLRLKSCIFHHQQIIMISDTAESEFNLVILVQFLGSIGLVCFQLFQLSLLDPTSFEFAGMGLYLIIIQFEIFWYCWNGNEVSLYSEAIAKTVYNTNWIVLNKSSKKDVEMIMIRAQRPIKFTAGKFASLTLETFINILRGAASYFMVLKSLNE